jgi:transcriptional antiterminator NusG
MPGASCAPRSGRIGCFCDFTIGDSVRISGGQLDGFVGVVKSINLDDQTAEVIVSMFGRETPATISIMQVQKIDD